MFLNSKVGIDEFLLFSLIQHILHANLRGCNNEVVLKTLRTNVPFVAATQEHNDIMSLFIYKSQLKSLCWKRFYILMFFTKMGSFQIKYVSHSNSL